MTIEMPKERISFIGKPPVNPNEIQQDLDELHRLKQKVEDDLSLVVEKVEFNVNFASPVRLIPISDTHLFSVQTDTGKVNEIFEKLKEQNTYGIIMGDIIEGANPKITDHIGNVEIDFGKQIRAARQKLSPYIYAGKICCMSSTFSGHEGWGSRYLGIDVVELLAEGFAQPDGTPLRVLMNGGRLYIHLSNGETYSQLVYHAPGGGGSDEVNPLGAQRNRLWEYINHRGPVDGVGGGDWHHRAGAGKELIFDLEKGKERGHVLYSNGTTKGNDPARPDTFLTKMSKGPTVAPGVQLVLNQRRIGNEAHRNGDSVWASYGYQKGEVLYDAAKLLDRTEKQRQTKELVGQIIERSGGAKAEFDRRGSRTKVKDSRFDVPMFESFRWKVESPNNLPVLVYLLANARYSSTSFEKRDRENLLKIVKQVERNPFEFGLVMRHFVDPDAAKQFNRDEILDDMIDDLSGMADEGRLLGFMMSSSLLDERWKKDVLGDWYEEDYIDKWGYEKTRWVRERKEGFYPGTHIYRGLNNKVPLYLNQALMTLNFGDTEYKFLLMDHLASSGSEFDPFRGLVQARRKNLVSADVVAGGHMPGVGYMTTPDASYVATGWFSEYDSGGKSNKKRAPLGGQAVILLPDTKMVIPASTFLEATDLQTALMLQKGLKKEEKEKLFSKARK